MKTAFASLFFGIAVMISGFSAVAEAMVTPDLGRNVSEILPHSTPFLNDRSESLDIPSAMDRGTDCSNGSGGTSCCTSSNQCGAGEGDCDSDADCIGNLQCGQGSGNDDNCDTSLGFPATYDCCYEPGCGLKSIKTLTRSTPSWAKMDATLKFQICHGELGNCCWTNELDDTNKNDFELGNMDVWDSQAKGLGACEGFVIPSNVDDLRVYIKHTSEDGWYGQTIWIVTECASLDIPINEFIDSGDYYEVCSGDISNQKPAYLREIVTKTRSSPDWSKMDDQVKLQICHGKLGCCCWTDLLNNPNKNDYELGNVDHFDSAEDGLGDCLNFPFPSTNADLRVFIQHSGSDAWYGEKIWIALQDMDHNEMEGFEITEAIDNDEYKIIKA